VAGGGLLVCVSSGFWIWGLGVGLGWVCGVRWCGGVGRMLGGFCLCVCAGNGLSGVWRFLGVGGLVRSGFWFCFAGCFRRGVWVVCWLRLVLGWGWLISVVCLCVFVLGVLVCGVVVVCSVSGCVWCRLGPERGVGGGFALWFSWVCYLGMGVSVVRDCYGVGTGAVVTGCGEFVGRMLFWMLVFVHS